MTQVLRVYLLRGLGDKMTSGGMDAEVPKLEALGAVVKITNWYDWQSVVADIKAHPNDAHAVIGYSMGANEVTQIDSVLSYTKCKLDLLVAMDPTIWYAMWELHDTTKRAICFHNGGWSLVGHARVRALQVSHPNIQTIEISENHMLVDWDQSAVWPPVIAAIKDIQKGLK